MFLISTAFLKKDSTAYNNISYFIHFIAVHGDCDQGNDCVCRPEWTGPNCDQGTCRLYN